MEIIKLGGCEFTKEAAKKIYEEKKYICTYYGIYQVFYSAVNDQFYSRKVIDYKNYARRGRFYLHTGAEVNSTLNMEILN